MIHPLVQPISSPSTSIRITKQRILQWAATYPFVAFLDNCEQDMDAYGQYELLVGVAQAHAHTIERFEDFPEDVTTWMMGLIPYELKNALEPTVTSRGPVLLDWPEVALFVPEIVLAIPRGSQQLICLQGTMPDLSPEVLWPVQSFQQMDFQSMVSQDDYLQTIHRLQQHIKDGDCYEINLAQAFTAQGKLADPAYIFHQLTHISAVPFAAFFRWQHQYIMSASPERFLQLHENRLLTQPIKGTIVRGKDPQEDLQLKTQLAHSPKEQAENVMIVDLSRHDLHRSCQVGSVSVPHLFQIQAFPQVFQMVSTIMGQKAPSVSSKQAIANTFPPGSMTGAPKVRTMQLIDQYEPVSRGGYAGSIGYVKPGGDFDWNVIIRSLMYDAAAEVAHYHVGGAITYDSDPMSEYEETLVKAAAIRALFQETYTSNQAETR